MTQVIEVPGVGEVEFPDDMNDDQIAAAIKSNLSEEPSYIVDGQVVKKSEIGADDPRFYNQGDAAEKELLHGSRDMLRSGALAGRTILNTVAGAPLVAMNAGVAGRNIITGSDYEMPSEMWRQALNAAGVPEHQGFVEKGGDILGQMLLGSRMPAPSVQNKAPPGFDPKTLKQLAFDKARAEGYRVPPSTVNPSTTNKILESIGGKVAMEQDASLANQKVTDALMKRALGVDEASEVAEGALPAIRNQAGGAYKALRGLGTMRADSSYGKELDIIASKYTGAAKDFPEIARADVLKTVEAVRKSSFDADSALDAIAILRDKSSTAYAQGDKALGSAYRSISGAMEGAIERALSRRGEDAAKLLKEFRQARQLIAKTYTAEKALNPATGSFNAAKLATELAKGKPLSGDMKKVAEFATAFPKAGKLVLDSGSVRNTDVILGAGTAALAREPTYLLYPFLRQALRAGMLSNAGQKVLTQPGIQESPQSALSILYGTQGLLGQ